MKFAKLLFAAMLLIIAVAAYSAPNPAPSPAPSPAPNQPQPKKPNEDEFLKTFETDGLKIIFYVKATPKAHLQFTKVTHEVNIYIINDKRQMVGDCKVTFELLNKDKSVYKGEALAQKADANNPMAHGLYKSELGLPSGEYNLKLDIVQGKKVIKLTGPIKFP